MNGPYTTISRRIIRTGIEHHDARPMSDWQRERSEPRLQPVRRSEPLWHSILAGLGLTVTTVALVLASAWLS